MLLARHLRSLQRKGDPPNPRGTWGNFGETKGGVGKWRSGEKKRQYL